MLCEAGVFKAPSPTVPEVGMTIPTSCDVGYKYGTVFDGFIGRFLKRMEHLLNVDLRFDGDGDGVDLVVVGA